MNIYANNGSEREFLLKEIESSRLAVGIAYKIVLFMKENVEEDTIPPHSHLLRSLSLLPVLKVNARLQNFLFTDSLLILPPFPHNLIEIQSLGHSKSFSCFPFHKFSALTLKKHFYRLSSHCVPNIVKYKIQRKAPLWRQSSQQIKPNVRSSRYHSSVVKMSSSQTACIYSTHGRQTVCSDCTFPMAKV